MSVTATLHHRIRRPRAAGAVLLALTALGAASGCSGLGRTAVGPVIYTNERDVEVMEQSPLVRGCHALPGGAKTVDNNTLIDMVLYRSRDCTGKGSTYLSTRLTDQDAPSTPVWRSYTLVH
ncbi:hypothetical protein OG233_24180 [Streptomyces sp. NBC_01218]|uniref:hypothetical protein n=1 Tax=unclassified Streptomyces TaxID=2593676 RepID=UPI0023B8B1CD|nr:MULTISPECIES: hypothetical protein [unclassified Streptomyces]WEH42371.1 hypothetical protein PZB77_24340 [Streptomyces sp. AM 2-1-1]WSQ53993.1 hypothetical protein OG233_24180 [Streptomyces sp. NBC_01218]